MEKQELNSPLNNFLNEISILGINSNEYRFLNGMGWIRAKDYKDLPTNLKKQYFWELEPLNESLLKQLQRSAVNELTLLSDEQLKRFVVRLSLLNGFNRFYDFIKTFYVKFTTGKHDGLDVMDFKQELESCFFTELPTQGDFDIIFLGELQDQVFYKNSLLDGLKYQIEKLLPETPQQTKQPEKKPVDISQIENNFDRRDIKEVYDYFKINLVDEKRLSEPDLIEYLKAAFELEKPPKNRFRLDYNTKKQIQKVFHVYYKDIAGQPYGEAENYLNLLKNYFVGFENLSTSNFSKTY